MGACIDIASINIEWVGWCLFWPTTWINNIPHKVVFFSQIQSHLCKSAEQSNFYYIKACFWNLSKWLLLCINTVHELITLSDTSDEVLKEGTIDHKQWIHFVMCSWNVRITFPVYCITWSTYWRPNLIGNFRGKEKYACSMCRRAYS